MHFHLPKPLHGWREFAGEVGIIMLGVLLALGAEQLVEAAHDRRKLVEAEDALAAEVATNLTNATIRLRMTQCVDNRLDQLGAWLDRASAQHRLPPLGPFGRERQAPMTTATFASFIASPMATELPQSTLAPLRGAYLYAELMKSTQEDETHSWNILWTLVGPGRDLRTDEEAQLRQTIISARTANLRAGYLAADLANEVRRLRLPFTNEQRQALRKVSGEPLTEMDSTRLCVNAQRPAPSHYGMSPDSYFQFLVTNALRAGPQLGPSNRGL